MPTLPKLYTLSGSYDAQTPILEALRTDDTTVLDLRNAHASLLPNACPNPQEFVLSSLYTTLSEPSPPTRILLALPLSCDPAHALCVLGARKRQGPRFLDLMSFHGITLCVDPNHLQHDLLPPDPDEPNTTSHTTPTESWFDWIRSAHNILTTQPNPTLQTLHTLLNPNAHLLPSCESSTIASILEKPPVTLLNLLKSDHFKSLLHTNDQNPTPHHYIFRSQRPIHPDRWVQSIPSIFQHITHARGILWSARTMAHPLTVSQSLGHLRMSAAPPWLSERLPLGESGPLGTAIANMWSGPFGDRRQELVLVGHRADWDHVQQTLQSCLLTDDEMNLGQMGWKVYFQDKILLPFYIHFPNLAFG